MIRRSFLALATSALIFTACQKQAAPESSAEPTFTYAQTIHLVRHAEKILGVENPGLTEAGYARAEDLADKLAGEGVTHIHSSNYRRTLETAQPLADRLGLNVALYDPKDLPAMAEHLKTIPGVHLVVGHSNTTPELTTILAGEEVESMPETEYDRFLTVNLGADGKAVNWSLSRYGELQ